MNKVLHWLGIEKRSEYVDDYFAMANFRSSIYMSSVIIVLEVWMLVSLVYRWITGDTTRSSAWDSITKVFSLPSPTTTNCAFGTPTLAHTPMHSRR